MIADWQADEAKGGYQACLSALDSREASYEAEVGQSDGSLDLKPLDLIVQANTVECGILQMRESNVSMGQERDRLRAQAVSLDEAWLGAHRLAPRKFPDFPGRDKSQQVMRESAGVLQQSIDQNNYWIDRNTTEVARLFELSIEVAQKDLTDEQTTLLRSAYNASAQNDILKRLMDAAKKMSGAARPVPLAPAA